MLRRDLLRVAASGAALAFLPRDVEAAWARVASRAAQPVATGQPSSVLSATQRATLSALADVIIPRTDSPGATDVGVVAWIDVMAADYYTDAERLELTAGLDAIDALARQNGATSFATLPPSALAAVMKSLDAPTDRTLPAVRGYQRVKGLVVHGYFTSERVQKTVLKTDIMPGRFVGDAPMPARRGGKRDE